MTIALALGIAFGLGGKEYVEQNIDRWAAEGKSEASSSERGDERGSGVVSMLSASVVVTSKNLHACRRSARGESLGE